MTTTAGLSKGDRTLTVRVPLPPRRRGRRKFIVGPEGTWTGARVVVDNSIVKALARAHGWKTMLERAEYASLSELARAEKINLSYVCRVLRLTLLAPDIMEALLDGKHTELQLADLLGPIPLDWADQRMKLGCARGAAEHG